MVYVEGRWGKIGLELGEAEARYKREQAYQKDRARAMAQAQEELEREQSERKAGTEAFGQRLNLAEEEAASQAPGALAPGEAGPFSVEEQRVHERFARIRKVADNLSPENRERWLAEEKDRLTQAAMGRARKKVAEGIQDRYQHGGFNLLDETEPNPAIDARVEELMRALDSDQIDPIKAAEVEAELLGVVRKENERRLARKRGTAMIEQQLQKAIDSGNTQLASSLETIHAMWGTGELQPDDLVDSMFEAQYGRKTARASAPNPFDVRKEALRLHETYEPGVPPTEESLQKYLEILVPPAAMPTPNKKQVIAASTAVPGARGTEPDPRAALAGPPPFEPPTSVPAEPKKGAEAAQRPQEPRAAPGKASAGGGAAPRPWAKLAPKERNQAEKDLLATAAKGGDLRKLLKSLGITDPDALPTRLKRRLLELARKAGGPTMGETLARLRPGAGGM